MKKILDWHIAIIVIVLLITVFFAFQIKNLKIEGNINEFIPKDNPARITLDKVKELYQEGNLILLAMQFDSNILSKHNIEKIWDVSESLEQLDSVIDVMSLTTAPYVSGDEEGINAEDLVPSIPETDEDIREIKQKLYFSNMYRNVFYSQDMLSTQIIVEIQNDDQEKTIFSDSNKLKNENSSSETIKQIRSVLDKEKEDGSFEYLLAGEEYVTLSISNGIVNDFIIMVPILLLVLFIILYLAFKGLSGVLFPLITVIISCIWTMGMMSLLGAPFTVGSSVIPVLLLAIGTAYGIHLINHYYFELREFPQEGRISADDHKTLILNSIKKVGIPIFLAGITTAAGFISLIFNEAKPIKDMGFFTAIGVISALIITLVFIPAFLCLKRGHVVKKIDPQKKESAIVQSMLDFLYRDFIKKKKVLFLIIFTIIVFSVAGIFKIQVGQPAINFFKPDSEIRRSDSFVNENMAGSTIINVLIEGKESISTGPDVNEETAEFSDEDFEIPSLTPDISEDDFLVPGEIPDEPVTEKEKETGKNYNSVKNPEILKAMDDLTQFLLNKYPQIKKINSFSDLIKEMNMVMHGDSKITERQKEITGNDFIRIIQNAYINSTKINITAAELTENILREMGYAGKDYYEIPYNPEKYNLSTMKDLQDLISQYLLLYSGEVEDLIDNIGNPVKTRMYIMMNSADPELYKEIKKDILNFAEKNMEPLGYSVQTAGSQDLLLVLNDLIVNGQMLSLLFAFIAVFLIIAIDYKSLSAGIIGILPIVITLLLNFGVMGWLGIPLDVVTAMIASITIGIGIDYSIHFLSAFKRHAQEENDIDTITKKVLSTTGKAIIFNSTSVAAGFIILLFSQFTMLNTFGLLVAVTMFCSALLSLTLVPVVIITLRPGFVYQSLKKT
jgi:predicted RND superfamily exporter protein